MVAQNEIEWSDFGLFESEYFNALMLGDDQVYQINGKGLSG